MRGVCALNFEAMSLLNDPQGGFLVKIDPLPKFNRKGPHLKLPSQ